MKPEDCDDCPNCPGFGSYFCCQTYGDYHDDYLADCIDNESRDDYDD